MPTVLLLADKRPSIGFLLTKTVAWYGAGRNPSWETLNDNVRELTVWAQLVSD
jgi:hypothetical protein